jgi:hypothetical protein
MTVLAPVVVDTAALAVHLKCTPAHVRLLVSEGVIAPIGRRPVARLGRPAMLFDIDAVDDAMAAAFASGRVRRTRLDHGLRVVRKSKSTSAHCR